MMRPMQASPLLVALGAQLGGALMTFALIWVIRPFIEPSLFAVVVVQGLCAALVSWKTGAPRWWWLIHAAFAPLVLTTLALNMSPGLYLAAFALCLLVFWRTDKNRVPLYLSNADTAAAVAELLPPGAHMIDLGCGDGRLLRRIALTRTDCRFTGIEHAPLPWLLARLFNMACRNVSIRYGDLWQPALTAFDVVYVFLSPAPMAALADKVRAEMKNGKLLISNSFPVPDVEPEMKISLNDRRQTQLFCYKTSLRSFAKPKN